MYNFNHLYYFYMTAKSGGVTAASEHLHISQPSLSAQLKVLEGHLGVKLFHKSGRHLELTEQGKLVFDYCGNMFEQAEQMALRLSKSIPLAKRDIRVGVSKKLDRSFIDSVMAELFSRIPVALRPHLFIVMCDEDALFEKLSFKELDFVVSEHQSYEESYELVYKVELPVSLIGPSSSVTDTPYSEMEWVLPMASGVFHRQVKKFFCDHQLTGRVLIETDTFHSALHYVSRGIGWTFAPVEAVKLGHFSKQVYVLGPTSGHWTYAFHFFAHKTIQEDIALTPFRDQLVQILRECSYITSSY